ncbi:glycosyltransferase family 2 protein [Hymenobacter siberiensis]|jgi:cellulose synthase (UDP-forming)|nr:cellulose synthase catalytic subunit [Hymenobacter siberiensis]
MRWLVGIGIISLIYFGWWFFANLRIGFPLLFWPLALSIGFKLLLVLHEWAHYVQVRVPVPPAYTPPVRRVDVMTTAFPGEPLDMIIHTLEAMQAIRYPHTSYLCDEGDDPVLRAACLRLGIIHVTRLVKTDAKAGNINHALQQATGEVCVVLDPDHAPTTDFLDQVMPYFEDERIGFVQVVQAYSNQAESLVARAAAEQTYHFYGPLMMGMNGYGTVQAIGANCTFRRAALDSIGGHAVGLTEDMHTAMCLHAAGWRSVYVPEIVSRGLVPASLAAFYSQQLKWSRGAFDLLFRVYPKLFTRFTWSQRIHYLVLPLYFFSGVIALLDLSIPLVSLGISQFPWLVSLNALIRHAFPLLGMALLIRFYAQRWMREPGEGGLHLAGGFLLVGTWWVYTLGFLYAVLGIQVPYLPTPKVGRKYNEWALALPNILFALLLLAACVHSQLVDATGYATSQYIITMMVVSVASAGVLLAATVMGLHRTVFHFMRELAKLPFRGMAMGLHRLQNKLGRLLAGSVSMYSLLIALIGVSSVFFFTYRQQQWLLQVPPEWLLNGGGNETHIGREATPTVDSDTEASTKWKIGLPFNSFQTSTINALTLPAIDPATRLPLQVYKLASKHQIMMITWTVSAQELQNANYWPQLVRQLMVVPGPLLLRPLLQSPSPDRYRRDWALMASTFRAAKVPNVLWVWTPEAADPLLKKFPGVANVNWMATPLVADTLSISFAELRRHLVSNLVNQVPVLLLAPPATGKLSTIANRIAWQYPEIKIVVFAAPKPSISTSPITLNSTNRSFN